MNNAIKISAPKSRLYTKLNINPHFSHINVHGLATPLVYRVYIISNLRSLMFIHSDCSDTESVERGIL